MNRVYLDWNATAPLRPEARATMIAAMDVVGNPSSVHGEGRAAKAIVERARGQVATLVGCAREEVVFTSGATEGNNQVLSTFNGPYLVTDAEHDSIAKLVESSLIASNLRYVKMQSNGAIDVADCRALAADLRNLNFSDINGVFGDGVIVTALSSANGETGAIHDPSEIFFSFDPNIWDVRLVDITQSVGKHAFESGYLKPVEMEKPLIIDRIGATHIVGSAHKFGGPEGVGFLLMHPNSMVSKFVGGGQEKGSRSGTENVIGIAGMGAAAEAAQRDLENGIWDQVAELRDGFEDRILNDAPDVIIFGKEVERLPNTSYFAVKGWKGETQVMQMDLAGFAVSAGSACSSGKTKASRTLKAMGFDDLTASSALRVSIGPTTTKQELDRFATAWLKEYRRFKARAA